MPISYTSSNPNVEWDKKLAVRAPDPVDPNDPNNPMARRMMSMGVPQTDMTKSLPQFDVARTKAKEQNSTQTAEAQDALARRFASMGGGPSGSWIKQASLTDQKSGEDLSNQMNEIGAQEAQQKEALHQTDVGRQFSEMQAENQRQFAGSEAEKQRGFQKELVDADNAFKQKVFNFDSSTKLSQIDLANKEYARDTSTIDFNKAIAAAESGDKDYLNQWLAAQMGTKKPAALPPAISSVIGTVPLPVDITTGRRF